MFPNLDGHFSKLPKPSFERPLISVTGRLQADSKTIEIGEKKDALWVMQSEGEMPEVAFRTEEVNAEKLKKNFPELNLPSDRLQRYMQRKAAAFNSLEEWIAYLKESNCTFAFGTRFHGNMCALLAGIPALWITHDSRTEELVKTLHLPHITCEEYKNIKSPEEVLEFCNYEEFYLSYPNLIHEYVSFLNENKISHHFHI